jgi:hypothetical protein
LNSRHDEQDEVRADSRVATGAQDDGIDPGPPPRVVRDLVRAVAADPAYLAERLTIYTLAWWGPRARRDLETLRQRNPDADPEELRRAVVERTVRTCMVEGSFLGGPFMVLLPAAFCSALLSQIKMILELGALAGRTPTEPVRAAEVLVIQGVHPDVPTAEAALRTAAAREPRDKGKPRMRALGQAVWRMARLLGILAPETGKVKPRLRRRIAGWTVLMGTFLVGMVIPLVWMPYLAVGYRRGTLDVAARATAAYTGPSGDIRAESESGRVAPFMAGAVGRALVGVVGTVVLALAFFLADVALVGNRWSTAAVVLVAMAALTGGIWYVNRRRARRKSQASDQPDTGEA